MVVLVSYAWLASSTAGSVPPSPLLPDCNDQLPVWHGRGNASVWPPVCTPEAADMFQFGPPPDPGIPCCAGLAPCQEKRPATYEGASVFDSVIVCRKPECCPKPAASPKPAAARPNFLIVMADDLGYGEVGAFPAGSAHGRLATPHLDRFARGAMVFTDSYAGYTVCAPSRTTLMTGYHSGSFEAHGLSGTAIPPSQDVVLLPAMLKAAGYATAVIGKAAPLTAPAAQGFDYFIGQVDQNLCHNMYPRYIDVGNGTQNLNLTRNWAVPPSAAAAREACMAAPHAFNYTVRAPPPICAPMEPPVCRAARRALHQTSTVQRPTQRPARRRWTSRTSTRSSGSVGVRAARGRRSTASPSSCTWPSRCRTLAAGGTSRTTPSRVRPCRPTASMRRAARGPRSSEITRRWSR